ncbi:methyltransferase family protein [Candidatus Enterococcus mansonii]|uniref:Phospholipid methyltransferase n=1 Tax=Candidatus Enterococcus mansonii TaxID=1834181 RepID=A0A242CH07_9ENTE|nr:isoprenylcysteine carboxylmethyltransferase family protein [Enterococcus sp. 4G2_DIV0659]OTO09517.1 hypothetical protein A5880_000196 [Enterococcus sp. 4G2_DIV0659]
MNGFVIVVPIFLIRFLLMNNINSVAAKEAAKFAPVLGIEKFFYYIYQITTILLVILPIFLRSHFKSGINYLGVGLYLIGLIVLLLSTIDFSKQKPNTLRVYGIYQYSRNPMYLGYLLFFFGCTLIMQSVNLFICLVLFQLSTHFIILSEERWCEDHFGSEYNDYSGRVRRYF